MNATSVPSDIPGCQLAAGAGPERERRGGTPGHGHDGHVQRGRYPDAGRRAVGPGFPPGDTVERITESRLERSATRM